MSKITDGPWEVIKNYEGSRIDGIGAVKTKTVLVSTNICCKATPADYALMAAAPDALDLLKDMLREFNDWYDGQPMSKERSNLIERARAVIAKAEGIK